MLSAHLMIIALQGGLQLDGVPPLKIRDDGGPVFFVQNADKNPGMALTGCSAQGKPNFKDSLLSLHARRCLAIIWALRVR
jgi:hypothetical protein